MKHLLLFISLSCLLLSCHHKNEEYITVFGSVDTTYYPWVKEIVLDGNYNPFKINNKRIQSSIIENGTFNINAPNNDSGIYTIHYPEWAEVTTLFFGETTRKELSISIAEPAIEIKEPAFIKFKSKYSVLDEFYLKVKRIFYRFNFEAISLDIRSYQTLMYLKKEDLKAELHALPKENISNTYHIEYIERFIEYSYLKNLLFSLDFIYPKEELIVSEYLYVKRNIIQFLKTLPPIHDPIYFSFMEQLTGKIHDISVLNKGLPDDVLYKKLRYTFKGEHRDIAICCYFKNYIMGYFSGLSVQNKLIVKEQLQEFKSYCTDIDYYNYCKHVIDDSTKSGKKINNLKNN